MPIKIAKGAIDTVIKIIDATRTVAKRKQHVHPTHLKRNNKMFISIFILNIL